MRTTSTRGKRLGGFRGRAGTAADCAKARRAKSLAAKSRAADLAPVIEDIRAAGANSLRSIAKGGSEGQVTRAARYFAIVAVGGELARVGLDLPWADGEAAAAAETCFKAWMAQRGGSGRHEVLTAIAALREAIESMVRPVFNT